LINVKALVVHRDPCRRSELVRLLQSRGQDVTAVASAEQAPKEGDFGLVLLDWSAGADAPGIVRGLRREDRVIVALVEGRARAEIEQLLAAGASQVLVEPVQDERLWAALVSAEYQAADSLRRQRLLAAVRHSAQRFRSHEQMLTRRAFYDGLTGLANRALFMDRTEHALAHHGRRSATPALLFIDLDGFKSINDSFGHEVGDAVLAAVARRVLECKREGDTAARLGGDEFTVLLESIEKRRDAVQVAERILWALRQPLAIPEHDLSVTVSIGVAYAEARISARELLRRADAAMYRAKQLGKDRYVVWDPHHETARSPVAQRTHQRKNAG
jgi:diguanylate cyclase (GGDEF)-like protein